jgi:hypothetical protein
MLRRREVIGWSILALMMVWPLTLWGTGGEDQGPKTPIASLEVQAERIDWLPKVDFERLDLTIAGPRNFYVRQEFKSGQAPQFNLVNSKGDRLPDGSYAYELRLVPRPGDTLPKDLLVQSGHLWIQGGSFVDWRSVPHAPPSPRTPASKPLLGISPFKDIVQNDNLIVHGRACIGSECVSGDANVPALKLKEATEARITFESAFFPFHPSTRSWALQANKEDELSGAFLIRDLTANTIPFRIAGGAATPDNSLVVALNGNIGLGTLTPGAKLHVFGSPTDDVWVTTGPDPFNGPAFNFGYGGTSFGRGAAFLNARQDPAAIAPNPSLRFLTATVERMIITNVGNVGIGTTSPSSKLHVNGGDIRVSGGSFIDDGVTLNAPDYVFEPSYKLMPLQELREFVTQEKHLPNVPTAREVKEGGLNLSQFQMRLLEKVEELTLYTLTQDQRLTSQQEELLRLREQNALLQQRLAALEKALPSEEPE